MNLLTDYNLGRIAYTHETRGRYESVVDYVTVGTETMKGVNDNDAMEDMIMSESFYDLRQSHIKNIQSFAHKN